MTCLVVPSFHLLPSYQGKKSWFSSPHIVIPSMLQDSSINVTRRLKLNSAMISGDVGNSSKTRFCEIEAIKSAFFLI